MLDGFARSITYLRISITDRCNYRCRYCMPDGGIEKCTHEDICSLEGLRDMAAAAVRCGVKKIRVTGGEPLVRRGAVDFCRMLSEIPGVEELCVTTNGSLLKEVARPLRDAGVTHLNISLDTLNEERFRAITRLGTLQDVLDGIDAAERAGFAKIKLNCVLLGGVNDDEITDFVALTREHPWQASLSACRWAAERILARIFPRRRFWIAVRSWRPFRTTAWPRATVCRMQRGPSASSRR